MVDVGKNRIFKMKKSSTACICMCVDDNMSRFLSMLSSFLFTWIKNNHPSTGSINNHEKSLFVKNDFLCLGHYSSKKRQINALHTKLNNQCDKKENPFGWFEQNNALFIKINNQYSKKESQFSKIEYHRYKVFEELASVFEEILEKWFVKAINRKAILSRIKLIHKRRWHRLNEQYNFNPLQFLCECHFHNSELGDRRVIVHVTL